MAPAGIGNPLHIDPSPISPASYRREIEAELRQEHWGLEPPRRFEWEQPAPEER